MNVKRIISIALAMLVMSFVVPVYANAQAPPLPHSFWGSVEINDSSALPGTHVKATGDDVEVPIDFNPILTEELGQYGGPAWNDPKLLVQGEIDPETVIEFYVSRDGVNWYKAETDPATVHWDSGEIDRVDLTVDIPVTAAGGGGGGGAAPDTVAPSISNVGGCLDGVAETTADICWTTNELSTSQVEYWASPAMLSTLDETLVTSHHVNLAGLTPATTYHYKTMSKDAAGNLAVSPEYTFTTLGEALVPEPAPPEPAPPAPAPPEPAPPAPPPEVAAPINWPVVGGVIAGVIVVGLLIFFLVRRRAY